MIVLSQRIEDGLHPPGELSATALELRHRPGVLAAGGFGGHDRRSRGAPTCAAPARTSQSAWPSASANRTACGASPVDGFTPGGGSLIQRAIRTTAPTIKNAIKSPIRRAGRLPLSSDFDISNAFL